MSVIKVLLNDLWKDKRICLLIILYALTAWLIRNAFVGVGFIKLIIYAFFGPSWMIFTSESSLPSPLEWAAIVIGVVLALFTASLPSLLVSIIAFFISGRKLSSAVVVFVICGFVTTISLVSSDYVYKTVLRF